MAMGMYAQKFISEILSDYTMSFPQCEGDGAGGRGGGDLSLHRKLV